MHPVAFTSVVKKAPFLSEIISDTKNHPRKVSRSIYNRRLGRSFELMIQMLISSEDLSGYRN